MQPRILIVDHNPDELAVLLRSLRNHGYPEVSTAETVGEALALLDISLPDVILLELSLSLKDEHVLLRRLRGAPHWSGLPVLLITGRHRAQAIKAAIAEGASGFIPQPLNGLEIQYKIEQAVRGAASRAVELNDLLRPESAADVHGLRGTEPDRAEPSSSDTVDQQVGGPVRGPDRSTTA